MSIQFACECGKQFSVKDEFAGKRTKCPACGGALTVPMPATEPDDLSEEDKAFRALEEAPDAEPGYRATASDYDRPAAAPAGPAIPSAKKPKLKKPSKEEREARKHREPREPRQHDPDRAKKILYMIGGVVMILIGVGLVFLAFDGGAIRLGLFGGLIAFGGVGTFFQGVTGDFNEE
jgi:hypothetical protein